MSTKKTLKRIALVAVSTMGFGLLSVLPAKAGTTESVTLEEDSFSIELGSLAETNFSVTTDGNFNPGDYLFYSLQVIDSPDASQMEGEDGLGGAVAVSAGSAASGKFKFIEGAETEDENFELSKVEVNAGGAGVEDAGLLDTNISEDPASLTSVIRGKISFNPDEVGPYELALFIKSYSFNENDELVEAILARDDAEELLIAIGMALAYSEGAITINKIGESHLKAAVIELTEIAQEFEDGDE